MFQFTHPGGVRRDSSLSEQKLSLVSIHAPGRGATERQQTSLRTLRVSIHAPGRGATSTEWKQGDKFQEFQFTHPGGVRQLCSLVGISIEEFQFTHPGGVRRLRSRTDYQGSCFNSRTREGCDFPPLRPPGASRRFQFTHPGGVRPKEKKGTLQRAKSFNSRTREGCDFRCV